MVNPKYRWIAGEQLVLRTEFGKDKIIVQLTDLENAWVQEIDDPKLHKEKAWPKVFDKAPVASMKAGLDELEQHLLTGIIGEQVVVEREETGFKLLAKRGSQYWNFELNKVDDAKPVKINLVAEIVSHAASESKKVAELETIIKYKDDIIQNNLGVIRRATARTSKTANYIAKHEPTQLEQSSDPVNCLEQSFSEINKVDRKPPQKVKTPIPSSSSANEEMKKKSSIIPKPNRSRMFLSSSSQERSPKKRRLMDPPSSPPQDTQDTHDTHDTQNTQGDD